MTRSSSSSAKPPFPAKSLRKRPNLKKNTLKCENISDNNSQSSSNNFQKNHHYKNLSMLSVLEKQKESKAILRSVKKLLLFCTF